MLSCFTKLFILLAELSESLQDVLIIFIDWVCWFEVSIKTNIFVVIEIEKVTEVN